MDFLATSLGRIHFRHPGERNEPEFDIPHLWYDPNGTDNRLILGGCISRRLQSLDDNVNLQHYDKVMGDGCMDEIRGHGTEVLLGVSRRNLKNYNNRRNRKRTGARQKLGMAPVQKSTTAKDPSKVL